MIFFLNFIIIFLPLEGEFAWKMRSRFGSLPKQRVCVESALELQHCSAPQLHSAAPQPTLAPHKSHCAGEFISLSFSSAEVIGSDQWGKLKLLSSFPTPCEGCCLYMMWLQFPNWWIYFTAVVLSAWTKVAQEKSLPTKIPRKPKAKIRGCRRVWRWTIADNICS